MSPSTPPPVHQSKRSSKGNNNNNKSARLDYRTNLGNVKRVKKINFGEREREREADKKWTRFTVKKTCPRKKTQNPFSTEEGKKRGKEARKTQTKKVLNLNTQVRNNVNGKSKSQEDKCTTEEN